jgi:hypothetical protein
MTGVQGRDGGCGGSARVLICRKCNKSTPCSPEDLMCYMREGWPKCCGETMTLFIEAKLPGGDKA